MSLGVNFGPFQEGATDAHLAIVDAIARHDADGARLRMEQHLDVGSQLMKDALMRGQICRRRRRLASSGHPQFSPSESVCPLAPDLAPASCLLYTRQYFRLHPVKLPSNQRFTASRSDLKIHRSGFVRSNCSNCKRLGGCL